MISSGTAVPGSSGLLNQAIPVMPAPQPGTTVHGNRQARSGTQGISRTRARPLFSASGRNAILLSSAALLLVMIWRLREGAFYKSGAGWGYALGVVGGSLMLVLLLYPLRKKLRFMHGWGPVKYWFQFHMLAGVLGPTLILFHSTFRVGSFNAAIALASMLLVVASGLIGRFLYRKVHHGLYGSHTTRKELHEALAERIEWLRRPLSIRPAMKREVELYLALVSLQPVGWRRRWAHFLSLGVKRVQAERRVRRALAFTPAGDHTVLLDRNINALLHAIDKALRAAQRSAEFSSYERMFSLWHAVHIPFLCMLLITAIAHVVAVHIY